MKIRKAVIPVAGLGTRWLPASRSVPKVMLPVLDTPVVHLAVQEASEAGIEHVVLVLSRQQEAIGNYFGRNTDLEAALEQRGDGDTLRRMLAITEMVEISYVYQYEQLGLGHAILSTQAIVGDEPFAVFLPDDVIWGDAPTIVGMMEIFEQRGGCVVAVKEVPDEMIPGLGIVSSRPLDGRTLAIDGMVEKPSIAEAPSNLAIIGRYVLAPELFDILRGTRPGARGEIQITDALSTLLSTRPMFAYRFPGVHFDVGTPLGLLKASVHAALQRDDLAPGFREWLHEEMS
jgi:UTP--glucose-1-phosphate uridylyltransferase